MMMQQCCNEYVLATVNHNEHKGVLLNNKCLRHLMNRIQSKNYITVTNEIKTISSSYFDDKIHILKKTGYDELVLGYQT